MWFSGHCPNRFSPAPVHSKLPKNTLEMRYDFGAIMWESFCYPTSSVMCILHNSTAVLFMALPTITPPFPHRPPIRHIIKLKLVWCFSSKVWWIRHWNQTWVPSSHGCRVVFARLTTELKRKIWQRRNSAVQVWLVSQRLAFDLSVLFNTLSIGCDEWIIIELCMGSWWFVFKSQVLRPLLSNMCHLRWMNSDLYCTCI